MKSEMELLIHVTYCSWALNLDYYAKWRVRLMLMCIY